MAYALVRVHLRNLDAINPRIARPNRFIPWLFFLPAFSGLGGWALAMGAAPAVTYDDNALAVFSVRLLVASLIFAPLPWLLRWDWKTWYFGSAVFALASAALMQIFPFLSIFLYGDLPRGLSLGLLLVEVGVIGWWCARFVRVYRRIFADPDLWKKIYVEENDVIYYLQDVDKWVLEEKLKFNQSPSAMTFVGSMVFAFLLVPFMGPVTRFVGVPFTHIFLAIGGISISLLCLGLAVRCVLIFYYFPWKLKRATGKNVYVDMVTGPEETAK